MIVMSGSLAPHGRPRRHNVGARRHPLGWRKEPGHVGTNRRYAAGIDRRLDENILKMLARSAGAVQTLTPPGLRLDEVPLTIDPRPHRVKAWVRFGATPIRVDAVAARWTPDAVGIVFDVDGNARRCWVWSGAIDETPATLLP
jgi:hypothetical protein